MTWQKCSESYTDNNKNLNIHSEDQFMIPSESATILSLYLTVSNNSHQD